MGKQEEAILALLNKASVRITLFTTPKYSRSRYFHLLPDCPVLLCQIEKQPPPRNISESVDLINMFHEKRYYNLCPRCVYGDNNFELGRRSRPPLIGSVAQVFDGDISSLRKDGYTLDEIGQLTGVTRERVRQILKKYYPESCSTLMSVRKVAELLGCKYEFLLRFVKVNNFVPSVPSNKSKYRFSENDVLRLRDLITSGVSNRKCKICGAPLPTGKSAYCSNKCGKEGHRNKYRNWTPERLAHHKEQVKKWHDLHPDLVREMAKKAAKRYWQKHPEKFLRTSISMYIVTKQCSLPIGTTFQGKGFEGAFIISENGDKIPFSSVYNLSLGSNVRESQARTQARYHQKNKDKIAAQARERYYNNLGKCREGY